MVGLSLAGEDLVVPSCGALGMVPVALGEVPYVEDPCVDPCVTLEEFPYAGQGEVPYGVLGAVPCMAPLCVNLMILEGVPYVALVAPCVHQEGVPCVAPREVLCVGLGEILYVVLEEGEIPFEGDAALGLVFVAPEKKQ